LVAADPLATAPTSIAFGPDGQLYVAMANSANITRVSAPSTTPHLVRVIGSILSPGSPSLTFFKSDLGAAEPLDASVISSATLCSGGCTSQFFPVTITP